MVDAISAGRLDVGFARAYLPHEFETFGIDMDTSRQRYEATIGAILRLWTQQDVNEDTPFFSYRNANSLPQPTQRPHPPVWGAAVRSRQSFAWLAEQGFGLLVTPALTPLEEVAEHVALYRETFAEAHGQTGPQAQVLASLPLYVAETDDAAFRTGDKLLAEYLDVWASGTESWSRTRSSDYPGYTGMAHAIRAMSPEQFRTIGSAAVGCPDRVADRAHEIADTLGADGILWQVDFGGVAGEVSMKSLQLFIDKVLSRVGG
jgi:alkanesulfonate monooxygenase SsuD/methylene tetrahydromethanopterin reductase-like flavin-dependent oxidoreductase (luciferase family)